MLDLVVDASAIDQAHGGALGGQDAADDNAERAASQIRRRARVMGINLLSKNPSYSGGSKLRLVGPTCKWLRRTGSM